MKRLSAEADIPDLDTESGEYLELHGGRCGAGDTFVREVGWGGPATPPAQEPRGDDGYYSHISVSEIADDAATPSTRPTVSKP